MCMFMRRVSDPVRIVLLYNNIVLLQRVRVCLLPGKLDGR